MTEATFPDVYADGINVAGGPYGIALTFQLSDPARPGEADAMTPVARIRLSMELAAALAQVLQQAGSRPEPQAAGAR